MFFVHGVSGKQNRRSGKDVRIIITTSIKIKTFFLCSNVPNAHVMPLY